MRSDSRLTLLSTVNTLSRPLYRRHSTLSPHDTPKPQMTRRCIDGLRHARGGAVAPAIVRRAEKRAAFHHLARNLDFGRIRIVTLFSLRASGIDIAAAGVRDLIVFLIPIRRPLPNIAGH